MMTSSICRRVGNVTPVTGVTEVRLCGQAYAVAVLAQCVTVTGIPGAGADPVSVYFEPAAKRLLDRAHASRGEWVSTRLADPSIRQRTHWAALGIDVSKPDDINDGKAKTRWARALERALYRLHKRSGRSGSLRVEVGRRIPASPQFNPSDPGAGGFPPARQFRLKIDRGGSVAERAVRRLPDSQRIMVPAGTQEGGRYRPGGAWTGRGDRDY